eukprot:Trichotokara_eunicae@DN2462_c0_g1_i1.p1
MFDQRGGEHCAELRDSIVRTLYPRDGRGDESPELINIFSLIGELMVPLSRVIDEVLEVNVELYNSQCAKGEGVDLHLIRASFRRISEIIKGKEPSQIFKTISTDPVLKSLKLPSLGSLGSLRAFIEKNKKNVEEDELGSWQTFGCLALISCSLMLSSLHQSRDAEYELSFNVLNRAVENADEVIRQKDNSSVDTVAITRLLSQPGVLDAAAASDLAIRLQK